MTPHSYVAHLSDEEIHAFLRPTIMHAPGCTSCINRLAARAGTMLYEMKHGKDPVLLALKAGCT